MSKLAPLSLLRQGKWFVCSSPSSSAWISHGQTKVDFPQGWVPKRGLGDIQDRPEEFDVLSVDASASSKGPCHSAIPQRAWCPKDL